MDFVIKRIKYCYCIMIRIRLMSLLRADENMSCLYGLEDFI